MTSRLPPPTQPWHGDLHRAFCASPADVSAAARRAQDRKVDAFYNGAVSSSPPQPFEMAVWPDAPEAQSHSGIFDRARRWIAERLAA